MRTGGDRALPRFARRFDRVTGPLEVTREGDARRRRARRAVGPARDRAGGREHRAVAFRQIPKHFDVAVAPGVSVEQRVEPLARVGCYVPGGRFPLPSSLLMTAIPARVAGVREVIVVLPAAGAGRDGGGARGRRDPAVPHRRRARDRGARLRHGAAFRASTRSSAPATATSPPPRRSSRADCAIDFYAGPDRDRRSSPAPAGPTGSPPISSRRPSTIPTRARSSSPGAARSPIASPTAVAARSAGRPIVAQSLGAQRRRRS